MRDSFTTREPGLYSTFDEVPASPDLPTDFPRPRLRSRASEWLDVELKDAGSWLGSMADRNHESAGVVILAAWGAFLHRLTGQTEMALWLMRPGSAWGNDREGQTPEAYLLPVRSRFGPELNFLRYVAALNEQLTSTNLTFDIPHSLVSRSMAVVEGAFGKACPVIVQCGEDQKYRPAASRAFIRLNDGPAAIQRDAGGWELALHATEMENGGLELRCEYAPEVHARGTVQRWMTHFGVFLENLAATPGRNLQQIDLLTAAERNQMVYDWNRTETDFPSDACLHELIEAQVRRTPEATALVFDAGSLTYEDMNRRANRLARHLRTVGVRSESIVAILAERSLETIIGLIAVLKAGGAYLPLDPTHPDERLSAILRDARPVVVLAQDHLTETLTGHGVRVVRLSEGFHTEDGTDLPREATPDNAAYVIYTSGSSGLPKGVVNVHRGICNYVTWWRDYLKLTTGDRFMQKIPFTFDPSVAEIFGTLVSGAALVIARPGLHGDTRYLIETVCDQRVTAAFFVPSLLAAFVNDPDVTRCTSLRCVISGGEALSAELSDAFDSVLTAVELINIYGPTEAVIAVTAWRCASPSGGRPVPIGGPIANTRLYILDAAMQSVPIGVAGELHIGGIQVARGYLNRAALTAEKFVANPFAPGRLYKTGDLCRFRADGMIEFLSRIDDQVKLRGYRIEPGEIEAVLKKHPSVRDCVVMVRADERAPGGQLLAYVVGKGVITEELRRQAVQFLPDYMVPAVFVILERFPVTANGKLDRHALPGPEFGQREPQKIPPRDAFEVQLLNIWREALRQPTLGVTDSFFEFGGHSLLAVEIVAQIGRKLRRALPLSALFEAPTVTGLAQALRDQASTFPAATIVPIQPRGGRPPFFCVHDGFGSCMYFRKLADGLGLTQPFYGFLLRENLAQFGAVHSVRQLAAHYVAELVRIRPDGPLQLGGFCTGGVIAHEMACQLRALGREVALLALIDANNPLCPPRRQSVQERLRSRGEQLKELPAGERIGWLTDAAIGRLRGVIGRFSLQKAASRRLITPAAPADAPMHAAWDLLNRIEPEHKPQFYEGRAVLFRPAYSLNGRKYPPDRGWTLYAQGGLQIVDIPGEHGEMFACPNVAVLAEKLSPFLLTATPLASRGRQTEASAA